jgi:hypothetical protein
MDEESDSMETKVKEKATKQKIKRNINKNK